MLPINWMRGLAYPDLVLRLASLRASIVKSFPAFVEDRAGDVATRRDHRGHYESWIFDSI